MRIYKLNGSDDVWIMIGNDIDREFSEDESGVSVSLSVDGRSVVVGAPQDGGNGNGSGHVRVYTLNTFEDN